MEKYAKRIISELFKRKSYMKYKSIAFILFFLVFLLIILYSHLFNFRIDFIKKTFSNNIEIDEKIWIIFENSNCNDLNDRKFPRNWKIFGRINKKIYFCKLNRAFKDDFEFFRNLITNDVDKLGIFKYIPQDNYIWMDPYSLIINNKYDPSGKVCRRIFHSMTIETNDFPMDNWRIPFYLKERLIPYNKNANIMLEKSLLWFFPLLRDKENIDLYFQYISQNFKVRTIDLGKNISYHKNTLSSTHNLNLTVEKFLYQLNSTDIVSSTLNILKNVNFDWSIIKNFSSNEFCSPVYWKEIGDQKIKDPDCQKIKVNFTEQAPMIEDILLIIVFNEPLYKVIPYVNNLYIKLFKYIAYCGPDKFPTDYRGYFVQYKNIDGYCTGFIGNTCTSIYLAMRHKHTTGILIISDDMILNIHQLRNLTFGKFLIAKKDERLKGIHWGRRSNEITSAMDDIYYSNDVDFKECAQILNRRYFYRYKIRGGFGDIYYIPYKFSRKFIKLNNVFVDNNVTFEVAIPTIMHCLQTVEFFNTTRAGARERNKQWQKVHEFPVKLFIHPVKWGLMNETLPDYSLWQNLHCRTKYYINDKKIQPETMMYFIKNKEKLAYF